MNIQVVVLLGYLYAGFVFGLNFPSPLKYFELEDATKVTWQRNVNSQDSLLKALDGPAMMIEGHVVKNGTAITMKDSPDNLPFRSFLVQINFSHKKKGLSLYFDDISVVSDALPVIQEELVEGNLPLLLRADILPGPVSKLSPKVPADQFLSLVSSQLPDATLSLGWVTDLPSDYKGNRTYAKGYTENMKETIQAANIVQPVAFSVQAPFCRKPFESLKQLENAENNYMLRVMSVEDDEKLLVYSDIAQLVEEVGKDKVYLDMPDSQLENLYPFFSAGTVPKAVSSTTLAALLLLSFFL